MKCSDDSYMIMAKKINKNNNIGMQYRMTSLTVDISLVILKCSQSTLGLNVDNISFPGLFHQGRHV